MKVDINENETNNIDFEFFENMTRNQNVFLMDSALETKKIPKYRYDAIAKLSKVAIVSSSNCLK